MLTFVLDTIEGYARAHTSNESSLLRKLFNETLSKTKLPNMSIGHLEGTFLRFLVRATKAKRILEVGTFTGYSALAMAEVLPDDGEVTTLDIDPKATDLARLYWANSPHGEKINLILGDAKETLKTTCGPFDLIFIDAEKEDYPIYWDFCVPLAKSGGCLVADNVLWHGRVLNPKDKESQAIDSFNKKVLSDPRVEAVMLTVRDGMTLAYKK